MPDSRTAMPAVTTIRLVYLARLREAFGRSDEDLALMVPAPNVAAVLAVLRARGGIWAEELAAGRAVRVALNHTVAQADAPLRNGDEVALLPPVTGG
ncbi:MAG: MoaD/ThiS family protein [Betaproteobacteria bacterium]